MGEADKRFRRCPFCGQLSDLRAEVCSECRRPLTKAEIVEIGGKGSSDGESGMVVERFDKKGGREASAKEIPHLELESATDVLSRSVLGREKAATEVQAGNKRVGARVSREKLDFKLVDLKSDDFKSAQADLQSSDDVQRESSELPKDDIASFYEETQRKKRAEIDEIRKKELEYWRRVRTVEQIVIFTSRVLPWFAMALLIAFVIVPFVSNMFPQGTWEGHIFDNTRSVAFRMELSREGTQLVGNLQFSDDSYIKRFPFVLEGIVWDKNAPLKVRGSFKLRKLSLVIYPEESELRKVVLQGNWSGKKASGEARNFWGINANWDMDKL